MIATPPAKSAPDDGPQIDGGRKNNRLSTIVDEPFEALEMMRELAGKHPIVLITAAATFGAVIGWMVKRR